MESKKIEYKTSKEAQNRAKEIFGCKDKNPLSYLVNSNVKIGLDESMQEHFTSFLKQRLSKK